MSEISAPDRLLRILAARCDVCGPIHDEPINEPVYASELNDVWHLIAYALPKNGRLPIAGTETRTCGGHVLFATEPYDPNTGDN